MKNEIKKEDLDFSFLVDFALDEKSIGIIVAFLKLMQETKDKSFLKKILADIHYLFGKEKIGGTLSGKPYDKMSFTEFIQDECGITHYLSDILYNLERDQISESLESYAKVKKKHISFTQSEIKDLSEFIKRQF